MATHHANLDKAAAERRNKLQQLIGTFVEFHRGSAQLSATVT